MKKKFWKILALIIALALLIYLGYFANSMLGNPVSKWLATKGAEAYLVDHFPNTDYYIERIAFSFKDTRYHAFILSPTSVDTSFSITVDMLGRPQYDTYDSVANGWNTSRRLDDEYRELTDTIFESPSFPYKSNITYGKLEIHKREYIEDPNIRDIPDYAIVQDDLIIDKTYDISQLGAQAGHLIVYVDTEDISFEHAAQIMLELRAHFDGAGIPFYAMDLCLQYPLPEEGPRPDGDIWVEHFLYADIYEEGLTQRLEEAHNALIAYYEGQK